MKNLLSRKDKSLNKNISINRIVLTIVASAILVQGLFWLIDSMILLKSDMEEVNQIQTDYIKGQLKERVASVIDYSEYRSQEIESYLRQELLDRTYEAHTVMTSIYENNKSSKSKEEITFMIQNALRDIRFNDGRGYYFIDSLEGDVILYPVLASSEGSNILDLQDEAGNYVIRDEIGLVLSQGEGYIEGFWKNPSAGDDDLYKKITFVKMFEPYGWYLGCGDYLDEITQQIQAEVIDYVDSIQYGEDHGQYVFLHDFEGLELANGVYPEMVGKNFYDLEDVNGAKVYQEQIHMSINEGGGYLTHYWPNPSGQGQHKKLTYVAPLKKWGWIIGTGVDVSDLDQAIEAREDELRKFIWQRITVILFILLLLLLLSIRYIRLFTTKVQKNFSVFRDYMISAEMKLSEIDVASLDFMDFSELAEVTNSMTSRINHLLHYDELTGIYNRRYLMEQFKTMYDQFPSNIGMVLIDIDYFKKVNDDYGHEVGDEVLTLVAQIIYQSTPDSGAVGRFGGEEFIVVLPDYDLEATLAVAEGIRKHVDQADLDQIKRPLSISCGVSHSSQVAREKLFKVADDHLYMAKEAGRNRVVYKPM